jgi:polar amino acid transport system permease protein
LLTQRLVALVSDQAVALPGFISGFIALGLVFSAYSSEVFLAAFKSLKRGQIEAARALALPRFPTVVIVLLPQFARIALPGLANLWLVLLKDTSLISVIAVDDLMRQTYIAVGATKQPFPFYLVACLIYLCMSIVSSAGILAIERWSERGARRTA